MAHQELKRIIPGAKTALLLIHGIVGTPDHFAAFLPLIPDDYSVYNLLLDGHGKGVRDFSRSSMGKWRTQVSQAVKVLSENHEDILIVGHSMGCLLASELALSTPKIKGLFLLAIPLRLHFRLSMVGISLKVYLNRVSSSDQKALAALRCYGIKPDRNPFHYLGWIPRFLELFRLMKTVRRILPQLQTPCRVYLSAKDELVSLRSKALLEVNKNFSVSVLPDSTHYYYAPKDMEFLLSEFKNFIT